MQETQVLSLGLGQEDPLEEGMATHFSILSWRIPWTEEPDGLSWLKQLSMSMRGFQEPNSSFPPGINGLAFANSLSAAIV